MKYSITNALILITSVSLQIYLMTTENFLPYDQLGNTSVTNITVFILLAFLIIYTLLNLLIFGLLWILRRKEINKKTLIKVSLKYSTILAFGLLFVFLLNLFSILEWIWGLSILFIVFIALIIV
jgi:hypothetical protein